MQQTALPEAQCSLHEPEWGIWCALASAGTSGCLVYVASTRVAAESKECMELCSTGPDCFQVAQRCGIFASGMLPVGCESMSSAD